MFREWRAARRDRIVCLCALASDSLKAKSNDRSHASRSALDSAGRHFYATPRSATHTHVCIRTAAREKTYLTPIARLPLSRIIRSFATPNEAKRYVNRPRVHRVRDDPPIDQPREIVSFLSLLFEHIHSRARARSQRQPRIRLPCVPAYSSPRHHFSANR